MMSGRAISSSSQGQFGRIFSQRTRTYFFLLSVVIIFSATTISHAAQLETRVVRSESTVSLPSARDAYYVTSLAVSGLGASADLPNGTVGIPYSGSISGVGGVAPYHFSLSNGALPAGLVLNTVTGAVSGTPTVAIVKSFWVRIADALGNSTKLHTQISITAPVTASVTVAVSPASVSLASGATQQYSAMVQGTSNTAVSWSATAGTVSATGLFTAPVVSSNTAVTITATSSADPSVHASVPATVTAPVKVTVSVSASSSSITSGATDQFKASVQGASNTSVSWSASNGSITSTGLFTAPSVLTNTTVSVTATSVADSTARATVAITVNAPVSVSSYAPSAALCGTDTNGTPSTDSQCGVGGTNAYTGESASDLTSWCGGGVPGICAPVSSCNQALTEGTYSQHSKYYLTGNLSCGAGSLALQLTRYTDINLNGFKINGVVFSNLGVKGWHFFNGTLDCTVQYPSLIASGMYSYACLQGSNNGGTYTAGGGDQIRIHHISGQNSYGCSKFIQLDGNIPAPAGGWTEPAIVVYSNTFQSIPVPASCNREYAGVYSETQPVEYYNNRGDVNGTGQSNATQLLVVYGPKSNGTFPNYIHNNYLSCETFNVNNSESGGDTCRPVLCDGALSCHVQYNDIWPTNNRGVRLRDAINAEVDHNYFHGLSNANGYSGVAVHTGDNDIYSAYGQSLNQNVHDNTIELSAGSLGIFVRDQQGVTSSNNSYVCAVSGCSNAQVADIGNLPLVGGLAVNQATKVLSCSGCDFYNGGRAYKTGSSVTLSGWGNEGNNSTFVIVTGPTSTAPTQMVLADPSNVLVSESGGSSAGAYPTTALTIQNASFAAVAPDVLTMPQTVIQECSTLGISVSGGGTLLSSCN